VIGIFRVVVDKPRMTPRNEILVYQAVIFTAKLVLRKNPQAQPHKYAAVAARPCPASRSVPNVTPKAKTSMAMRVVTRLEVLTLGILAITR
jgi:hypothetical protein